MAMRETLLLVFAAIAIGVPASLTVTRFTSNLIFDFPYGVKVDDHSHHNGVDGRRPFCRLSAGAPCHAGRSDGGAEV